jgi:hypothetical protein
MGKTLFKHVIRLKRKVKIINESTNCERLKTPEAMGLFERKKVKTKKAPIFIEALL